MEKLFTSKVIGIDLGTTHTSVAIQKIVPETIPNQEGDLLTPSYATLTNKKQSAWKKGDSQWVIGKVAKDWQAQDPGNTVFSVKRLMGRKFSEPEVQKLIVDQRISYKIQPYSKGTENSIAVLLHGAEYLPEQISAEILKKVKQDAEVFLKEPVEAAVVTVPAYFNDKQKNATRMAASMAGLKVLRLIPEPTAAAISFGMREGQKGDAGKTLFIFDFGGGTLDLSILTFAENQFIEMGKGGDSWLGGDDIDQVIIDFVYKKTAEKSPLIGIPDAAAIG